MAEVPDWFSSVEEQFIETGELPVDVPDAQMDDTIWELSNVGSAGSAADELFMNRSEAFAAGFKLGQRLPHDTTSER